MVPKDSLPAPYLLTWERYIERVAMVVIEKWIQTEQKVEINLSAEDICQCLITSPINDNLDATLELLNTCATILNGIPDLTIREMSQEQKNVVCSFLQKAIDRFLK